MFYLSQFILARIRPDLSAWPAATHWLGQARPGPGGAGSCLLMHSRNIQKEAKLLWIVWIDLILLLTLFVKLGQCPIDPILLYFQLLHILPLLVNILPHRPTLVSHWAASQPGRGRTRRHKYFLLGDHGRLQMICYHKLVTSFLGKHSFVKELHTNVVLWV